MAENTARKLDNGELSPAPATKSRETQYLWFVARGSVLKGPYGTRELETLLKKREVRFEDFCWRHGFREWRPLMCVSDFDRRGNEKQVPYPTVEVPYGGADVLPFPSGRNTGARSFERRMRERRAETRAQVALAKTRRRTLTIYEWAFAVVAAIILAYTASHVALTELSEKLTARMEIMRLGVSSEIGSLPAGAPEAPATAWSPLFSAPGFKNFVEESKGTRGEAVTRKLMPTKIAIPLPPLSASSNVVTGGDYAIKANGEMPLWAPAKDSVDPVYARHTVLRGYLSGSDASVLWVELRGEPLVPQGVLLPPLPLMPLQGSNYGEP